MTARRKARKKIVEKGKKRKSMIRAFKLVVVLTSALIFCFLFFFNTKLWDGINKLSYVYPTEENVVVVVLDPEVGEITKVYIPASTQVESAHNLGIWKIGSIWQLGKEQNLDGELLEKTTTNRLLMPVVAWMSEEGEGLVSQNPKDLLLSVLKTTDTNLNMSDRVRIAFFSLRVKNPARKEIRMENTPYLRKAEFADGSQGYELTGKYPEMLLTLFTDTKFSKNPLTIIIRNHSGSASLAMRLSEVVEVVGAKVASILDEEVSTRTCLVKASDKKNAMAIAKYFKCDVEQVASHFDAEIEIGEDFINMF